MKSSDFTVMVFTSDMLALPAKPNSQAPAPPNTPDGRMECVMKRDLLPNGEASVTLSYGVLNPVHARHAPRG
jgi:hypothetical protein